MIDILIPTYKRASDLKENLASLSRQIQKDHMQSEVQIIVSDNNSPDDTEKVVADFSTENKDLTVQFHKQPENIGIEKNFVFVLSKATSDHVMFLGDDDVLPDGYISFCINEIQKDKNIGCIIPGNVNATPIKGNIDFRPSEYKHKHFAPGFNTMIEIVHYAHQISGIALKKESLLNEYLKADSRNLYPQIFFSLYNMNSYGSIYAPGFRVSINIENAKDWKYDSAGLLPEAYKSYYPFLNRLGEEKVSQLIYDFTRRQSWRLGVEPLKPVTSFKRISFLLKNTRTLKDLKTKLFILFLKEYFYRLFPFLNPIKVSGNPV